MSDRPEAPVPPEEMQEHPVSRAISLFWDGHDVWGSAMSEGFALCDFICFYLDESELIPHEMGYRPAGGMLPVNASEADGDPVYEQLVECYEGGDFTRDDVIGYLPILSRYLDACKAAGVDY